MKAELSSTVQIYQQFVDSSVALKKRENELRQTIDELEAKKAELQKPKLNEPLLEFHENNGNKDVSLEVQQEDISLEVQQEDVISTNDVLIPQPNMSINYHQNESETLPSSSQAKQSSRTLIFDTKDLF